MTLVQRFLRGSQSSVRFVSPVSYAAANGRVAEVYRQLERDFGMLAPPITLHSQAPDVLAAAWILLRETLLTGSPPERAAREAVAIEVSRQNSCPYCVEVHGATLDALGGKAESLARWSPELGAVEVTFHYLNRMVNVFLGDSPLPQNLPERAREPARRMVGRVAHPNEIIEAGGSLALLPEAQLPADLAWAADVPHVAQALARACDGIEGRARGALPNRVRARVLGELSGWHGEAPGMGRGWVERATANLPEPERVAAVLALLVAKASYQVDGDVIGDFRKQHAGDAVLIEVASWASMTAARRCARFEIERAGL